MNRAVIGLVVLLWMTTLAVPRTFAQARIPSADEFSNGPQSHNSSDLSAPSTPPGVSQMRVDWDLTERSGQPTIEGYVYNFDGVAVNGVQLRVDSLDAGGEPVSTELRPIQGVVPSEGRTYFEFPAPTPASNYQVTVDSAEPLEGTQ